MCMDDKAICGIIEDVLPLYMDSLTSEATTAFVQKHLQGCTNCQETFQHMKEPILSTPLKTKTIRYKKKYYLVLMLDIISILIILGFIGGITYYFFGNW